MNDRPQTADRDGGDWLDGVLREDARVHRATQLDGDRFTASVMAALPAAAAPPAWRKPALALLWAVAGIATAFALPEMVTDVSREILRVILGQRVSVAGIATGIVVLGAGTWLAAALALRED